jgi:hypothetical protein
MKGRIAIAGAIAQKPGSAGHAWQFLQYLLGFRRLGYEVLFLDRLDDADAAREGAGVAWLSGVLGDVGLGGAWSLDLGGGRCAGVGRRAALEFVADADILLNVMGYLTDEALLDAARRRVFLDTDPGFGQMWRALGLADVFAGHDVHVTIGEHIGAAGCTVPDNGLRWITTPQPVILDQWPVCPPGGGSRFTSIASWRGAYGPIDYDGHTYGLRVHQFRRFAELPRRAGGGGSFELALDIHPADDADRALLTGGGWAIVPPASVASTPDGYRRYIQASDAEIMVAKGIYVDSASGWLSERSLCYLASGRPVLAQQTGFSDLYPTGEGLLAFSTMQEAVAGVEAIRADPARHGAAARALAEEHFDSDRVLTRLLDRVGAAAVSTS